MSFGEISPITTRCSVPAQCERENWYASRSRRDARLSCSRLQRYLLSSRRGFRHSLVYLRYCRVRSAINVAGVPRSVCIFEMSGGGFSADGRTSAVIFQSLDNNSLRILPPPPRVLGGPIESRPKSAFVFPGGCVTRLSRRINRVCP